MMALEQPRRNRYAFVLLVAYLVLLFALTMAPPAYVPRQRVRLVPFVTIIRQFAKGGSGFLVNVPGNIVAFAPLGVLVPLCRDRLPSFTSTMLVGVLLSAGIELLQLGFTQRVADINDVLLNGFGTAVGYAGYYLYSAWSTARWTPNENA